MKSYLFAALLAASACGGSAGGKATATPKTALNPAQIAERALPSIVLIKAGDQLGTGFIVWADGRIATNLHVIASGLQASVTLPDGREFKDIVVMAADPERDLAVIRVGAQGLVPLRLGDSKQVKPGEPVVAIGHPLGFGNTVSNGLISAIRQLSPQMSLLQISAPIAPGSSGGPLFNDRGEVIGIATLYATEGQNLNFGVPVAYLKPLLLSEKAIPLSAFVSLMETRMLAGCSPEEVKGAIEAIDAAIKVGAPLYNKGDHEGCFKHYEKTALDQIGKLQSCPGVRETLLGGVAAAGKQDTPAKKAWAMRHAFDRIMGAVAAAIDAQQR
jgi:serine protease Do